jgi:hypothetical protein
MSINQDCPCTRAFFFADGRRCQLPPSADDMGLCNFHAKKYRDRITAEEAGRQISESLSNDVLTACDLSSALNTLFSATAQGYIKPKTAATLAYLGQLMLQTQRLAKQEFLESFDDRCPKSSTNPSASTHPSPLPPAPNPPYPANPAPPTILTPIPPPPASTHSPPAKSCSGTGTPACALSGRARVQPAL